MRSLKVPLILFALGILLSIEHLGAAPLVNGCGEVREPHDFIDQESEVAAGIMRFVLGSSYQEKALGF